MIYLKGDLEIMTPSQAHQTKQKFIATLLEHYALEHDIVLYGYGSKTFRNEKRLRGLEPDECFCRGKDRECPDFALEVIESHALLDKLRVYRGLGVSEVWLFEKEAFRVVALLGGRFTPLEKSLALPELDPEAACQVRDAD